jgi:hypothetical protein
MDSNKGTHKYELLLCQPKLANLAALMVMITGAAVREAVVAA